MDDDDNNNNDKQGELTNVRWVIKSVCAFDHSSYNVYIFNIFFDFIDYLIT